MLDQVFRCWPECGRIPRFASTKGKFQSHSACERGADLLTRIKCAGGIGRKEFERRRVLVSQYAVTNLMGGDGAFRVTT